MTTESYQGQELTLLDLLIICLENIKILTFVPLAAVLVAWPVTTLLPQTFVSYALVSLPSPSRFQSLTPAQASTLMASPVVIDPVITSLGLPEGKDIQISRANITNKIRVSVGRDGYLHLEVKATAADTANKLANAVIDSFLKATLPREQERIILEKQLFNAQNGLRLTTSIINKFAYDGGKVRENQYPPQVSSSSGLANIFEVQAQYLSEIETISRGIQGLSRDIVTQPPTLPKEAVEPRTNLVLLAVALFAFGFSILWIFLSVYWKTASQSPELAAKQAKLISMLGLKSRN